MEYKRMRSGNWTKEEKETLLELVRERVGVIESKACDGRINKMKQETWQEIVRLFEAKHGAGRGMLRVKEQWKRMKLMAKQNISKAYQKGTGAVGVVLPSEIDYMIMDLLAGQFTQDCNSYDSDNNETMNYNDSSSSISKEVTDCSPSLAVARQSSILGKHLAFGNASYPLREPACSVPTVPQRPVREKEEIVLDEEPPCSEVQATLSDSSEVVESGDRVKSSSVGSVGKHDEPNRSRKRKSCEMSAYEEAMYDLYAEKINTQIKILEEKAKREAEIHKGELEIQELQKMYWRNKIKKM